VATSGRYSLALEFTSNRQRLLAAVDKFQAGYGAFDVSDRGSNKEAARATFRYLAHMAGWLGAIEGRRKTIVFISEGFTADIPVGQPQPGSTDVSVAQNPADGDQPSVRFNQEDNEASNAFDALSGLSDDASELRDTIDAATRANVAIYGIDPRGRPGAAATTITPIATLIGDDAFSARRVASQQLLRVLSAATGGFALTNSNGFDDAFARVVDDNSSYYVLGYTSTNTKRDGKFRRIRLTTTRPGLRIRARAGYRAVHDKTTKPDRVPAGWTRELVDLMTVPAQVSGLTLTVSAASFRGAPRNSVAVVVETRGRDLRLAGAAAPASDEINLVIAAADDNGNIKASEKGTLAMNLSAESRQAIGRSGVRLASRLELQPGRYAVRVAGVDGNDRRGSVFYDLDVPDFTKGPLTMSGLLLTTHDAAVIPTSGTDRVWRTVLNGPPTAERTFRRDDELSVYAEVYDNDSRKGHDIDVITTVGDEQGHVQFSNEEHVTAASIKSDTMFPLHVVVPLRDLRPGAYLLRIETRSTAPGAPGVSQRVPFTVQ
jgi:VWFA-related protein